MGKFEDQLWADLAYAHGDELMTAQRTPPPRSRKPLALTVGALGVAGGVTALALTLTATASAPAYAVARNANGSITVTLHSAAQVAEANAELASMGVAVRVVNCDVSGKPRGTDVPGESDLVKSIYLDPETFSASKTIWVEATTDGNKVLELMLTDRGPKPTCQPYRPSFSGSDPSSPPSR